MISNRFRAWGLPLGPNMRIRLLGDFAVNPPSWGMSGNGVKNYSKRARWSRNR